MDAMFTVLAALIALAVLAGAMYNVGYSVYYAVTGFFSPYKSHKASALISAAFLTLAGGFHLLLVAAFIGACLATPHRLRLRRWRDAPGNAGYTVRDVTPRKRREMLERW